MYMERPWSKCPSATTRVYSAIVPGVANALHGSACSMAVPRPLCICYRAFAAMHGSHATQRHTVWKPPPEFWNFVLRPCRPRRT